MSAVDLGVRLAGMRLRGPVLAAAGCAGTGPELARFLDLSALGAVVTPSVSVAPRAGEGTPRLVEVPGGLVAATGLPGPGVAAFVAEDLPWLRSAGARVVVSIVGSSAGEYAEVAGRVRASAAFGSVVGVELNLAGTGAPGRSVPLAVDPLAAAKVVALVRERLPRDVPVIAKLSAEVTDVVEVARSCVKGGADALTLINSLPAMVIDTRTLRPALAAVAGGLSGSAVLPIAVRAVWVTRAAMLEGRMPSVPIIGVGGVRSGTDALQLLAAGASAVQVGSATFADPRAPLRVHEELATALADKGCASLADVVGIGHRGLERMKW